MSLEVKKLAMIQSDQCLVVNDKFYPCNIELPTENSQEPSWLMAFVANSTELNDVIPSIHKLIQKSRVFWLAYPKKTGKIKSDLNRDICWKMLVPFGLTPVSQISLDETWSALRFKNTELPPNWVEHYLKHEPKKKAISVREALIIPSELESLFIQHTEAKSFFEGLSYSCRKEYIVYISEAKKQETRDKRALATLDALNLKKKYR